MANCMHYPASHDQMGLPHPDPVVENASLAAVDPPDIYYELIMPTKIAEEGLLSDLQLETVVYACQRHEVRCLFFSGWHHQPSSSAYL